MTRYYSEAEVQALVRREVALERSRYQGIQQAVHTQNRSLVYSIVKEVASWVVGSTLGDLVGRGVEAVWNWFSEWF
jgi:hypothetical protein